MGTLADLTGSEPPPGIDSLSFAPELQSQPQKKHEVLYWEFHEGGTKQAVLMEEHWRAVRLRADGPTQIFDLTTDPGESRDLHDAQPALVQRAEELFRTARTDNPDWPIRLPGANKKPAPKE